MTQRLARAAVLSFLLCCAGSLLRAADLPALWKERTRCTVAVEFYVQTESERHGTVSYGVVVDGNGTIILPREAIDARIPPEQLKDFKVYLPGDSDGVPGAYLGEDEYTGWHFVRADPSVLSRLTPVTAFAASGDAPVPALGEDLWGIGLRPRDEDFQPYLMKSHLSYVQSLPVRTGTAQQEVAAPGLPVFNAAGVFVGLATSAGAQSFTLFSQRNPEGAPVFLVDVEESSIFQLAAEVLPYLGRIPKSPSGRPLTWLGADKLEPMGRDVASFLKLSPNQGGALVSEVLQDSPAEKAGMKDRDIILAIDGKPIPHFSPDRVVGEYVDRQIALRKPGEPMTLTVLRGTDRVELKATLGDAPKLAREAPRKYFERLGFTAREFVYGDAVERRLPPTRSDGAVVHYVKPNSPAAIAGLQPGDWIKEIDGIAPRTFDDAVKKLSEIAGDTTRAEFVLLVSRGADTAVLRVKLK